MAADTKISWATSTFNPWIGCSKVHAGCQNCYATEMAGRLGVKWGPNGTRRRTAKSTWKKVESWNRKIARTLPLLDGKPFRPRVFPSLCDPFEDWQGQVACTTKGLGSWSQSMSDVRRDFFALIDHCPNLDFLLLTKRPENIPRMVPMHWAPKSWGGKARPPHNVWLLYSASDQQSLDAGLHDIRNCRDLVPVWGLSMEPLIGPVEMRLPDTSPMFLPKWVIVGGESGPRHRPMEISWVESIADQCSAAGVPLWVKQDADRKPGQQGRITDALWARKELPCRA